MKNKSNPKRRDFVKIKVESLEIIFYSKARLAKVPAADVYWTNFLNCHIDIPPFFFIILFALFSIFHFFLKNSLFYIYIYFTLLYPFNNGK